MTEYTGVGGAWKTVSGRWVGVGGVWKPVETGWVGVGGVWKPFFDTFSPFTTNYDTPGTQTVTIPIGASSVQIICTGGGGGGIALSNSGGGAGTAIRTIPIATSDWNQTFSLTVGSGGPNSFPNSGATSDIALTVAAGSYHLFGGAGSQDNGIAFGGGVGGATNLNGGLGQNWPDHNPATGGSSYWASGGVGNASGSLGSGGGATGSGAGAGGNGRIQLAWS